MVCSVESHTGTRIFDKYEETLTLYNLTNKVSFVAKDNASNMKAASNAKFPVSADSFSDTSEPTDNEDLWTGVHDDVSVESIETGRISCFAHTLQLTVGDGIEETKAISLAMAKAVKLASILHRSTIYKVRMIGAQPKQLF